MNKNKFYFEKKKKMFSLCEMMHTESPHGQQININQGA